MKHSIVAPWVREIFARLPHAHLVRDGVEGTLLLEDGKFSVRCWAHIPDSALGPTRVWKDRVNPKRNPVPVVTRCVEWARRDFELRTLQEEAQNAVFKSNRSLKDTLAFAMEMRDTYGTVDYMEMRKPQCRHIIAWAKRLDS